MKIAVCFIMLLIPLSAFSDKYDDVNAGLREVLIALSQVSVQGKDAATFSQIQQGLVQISKDISNLKKECEDKADSSKSSIPEKK